LYVSCRDPSLLAETPIKDWISRGSDVDAVVASCGGQLAAHAS